MNPQERILIDIPSLIKYTGLGRTLIYSELKEGRLQGIKIGRRTLFTPESVQQWLSQQEKYHPQSQAGLQSKGEPNS